ncbi:MAG: hypothetical protein ACPG47_08405 [Leucothrix sp.]
MLKQLNLCKRPNTLVAQHYAVLLSLMVFTNLAAETPTTPQSNLAQTLDRFEFTLKNDSQYCQLQVKHESSDTKTIPLLLETPCYWVVSNESKALLHYSYEAVGADHTFLLAGTTLDWSTEKKTYQKLPTDAFCSQYLQGVIISKSEVYAVDEKMVAAHCETGLAMDEKIFYAMAHNPQRYQEKTVEAIEAKAKTAITTEATKPVKASSTTETAPKEEEKSFLDTVTDSLKGFFSGKKEDEK